MAHSPPAGITPPVPGLDHEEPELAVEDDIPTADDPEASISDELRKPECE